MTYKQLLNAKQGLDLLLDTKITYPKKVELYDLFTAIMQKLEGFDREHVRLNKEYISGKNESGLIYKDGKTKEEHEREFESLLDTEVLKVKAITMTESDFPDGAPSLREMYAVKDIIKFVE